MAETNERMILRTVYLDSATDDALRIKSFKDGLTKSEIIQEALKQYLSNIPSPTAPSHTVKKKCGRERNM